MRVQVTAISLNVNFIQIYEPTNQRKAEEVNNGLCSSRKFLRVEQEDREIILNLPVLEKERTVEKNFHISKRK